MNKPIKVCAKCGCDFRCATKQAVCPLCNDKNSKDKGEIIECKVCNKRVYKSPNKVKTVAGRYCCMAHYRIGSRTRLEYTCKRCNAKFWDVPSDKRVYCSLTCHKNIGMASMTVDGYLEKRVNGRNKRLHRIIMEKHLGRDLSGFDIHHINHNKLDNRIENLMVLTRAEHMRLHMRERQAKRALSHNPTEPTPHQ